MSESCNDRSIQVHYHSLQYTKGIILCDISTSCLYIKDRGHSNFLLKTLCPVRGQCDIIFSNHRLFHINSIMHPLALVLQPTSILLPICFGNTELNEFQCKDLINNKRLLSCLFLRHWQSTSFRKNLFLNRNINDFFCSKKTTNKYWKTYPIMNSDITQLNQKSHKLLDYSRIMWATIVQQFEKNKQPFL